MRPEISEVVREIYPKLIDDNSVKTFENIIGMDNKNYYFMDHDFEEK